MLSLSSAYGLATTCFVAMAVGFRVSLLFLWGGVCMIPHWCAFLLVYRWLVACVLCVCFVVIFVLYHGKRKRGVGLLTGFLCFVTLGLAWGVGHDNMYAFYSGTVFCVSLPQDDVVGRCLFLLDEPVSVFEGSDSDIVEMSNTAFSGLDSGDRVLCLGCQRLGSSGIASMDGLSLFPSPYMTSIGQVAGLVCVDELSYDDCPGFLSSVVVARFKSLTSDFNFNIMVPGSFGS